MKTWLMAVLCSFIFTLPVSAHPHVFITPKATIVISNHAVSQINVEWDFDDMSSALFKESGGSDSAAIWNLVFPQMQLLVNGSQAPRSGYYTYLEIDGKPYPNLTPAYFQTTFVDGILQCRFTLFINQPINHSVTLWFDDPTIYNQFDMDPGNFQIDNQSAQPVSLEQRSESGVDKIYVSF